MPPILDAFPAAASAASVSDPAEAMQVLEERHLVAVTEDPAARRRFAASLRMRLDLNHRATVVEVAEDLLGHGDDPGPALDAIPDALLAADGAKHQYFLWHDVDELAERHGAALRRTLHAAFAVSAEREFVSPETLVIQRHVLLGGPSLAEFAAGPWPLTEWLDGDEAGRWPEAADLAPSPRVVVLPLGTV